MWRMCHVLSLHMLGMCTVCVCACVCVCPTYVGELSCVPCLCYNIRRRYMPSMCALHMLMHVWEICVVFVCPAYAGDSALHVQEMLVDPVSYSGRTTHDG